MVGENGRYRIRENESYGSFAYRVLRDRIMKLDLLPSTPIVEADIAEELEISRTPVHEAVMRLRDETLIDILPRKESRVSKIDLARVNDGLFIRTCIEPELILISMGNLSTSLMHRMLLNINAQQRVLAAGNPLNEFNEIDDDFHMLLYYAANRGNAYAQIRKMLTHFDRVRYLARREGAFEEIDRQSYEEHRQIFSAVAYRSQLPTDAHSLIRSHVTRFQNRMDVLVERYSDYFYI